MKKCGMPRLDARFMVDSGAGMKEHACSCSRCSIILTKHVFVFVRVQYFQKNECSCSFVFNIFKKISVRVRSCSTLKKKYVFVFVRVRYFCENYVFVFYSCSCSFTV